MEARFTPAPAGAAVVGMFPVPVIAGPLALENSMPWMKRLMRSPVLLQVLVAALQLAAQLVRNESRKEKAKK
jgi:hypothetical protein